MSSVNQITLIGNFGKDIKSGGSDTNPIANFSIATNYEYKNREGNKVTETEWHRVAAFGQTARYVLEYAASGRQAYIQGRLRTRKWTDKDGNDRYVTEIIADTVNLLGSNPNAERGENRPAPTPRQQAPAQPQAQRQAPAPAATPAGAPADMDDDIPF